MQQDEENYTLVGVTSDIQYHVNITLRTCTCPVGVATGRCQHLQAVRMQRLQEVFYEITNSESFFLLYCMNQCGECEFF